MLARPRGQARAAGVRIAALCGCFLLSGMGSLILEVVWTRLLRLVFGSTTLAVSTILVAYMLGLGLGGLISGRLADRIRNGVRAYGWLEIGVAGCAILVPFVIDWLPDLTRTWFGSLSWWSFGLLTFVLSLLVLLVPTLMMGATLPVLVAALVRDDERIGAWIGLLYGVNTLGAVAGVLVGTFVLFPTLGLLRASFAGAGIYLGVGLAAALWLARGLPDAPVPSRSDGPEGGGSRILPLASYAAVGFTALGYEVGWTRALSTVLGSSIYAFAAMLAAFLVGIALGSLLARRFVDRVRRPQLVYASGVAALAGCSLGTSWLIPWLPGVFLRAVGLLGASATSLPVIYVGVSVLAMLPATLVLGALFPLLVRVLTGRSELASSRTGEVYFANALGSAAGAFAAGFVLIAWLGLGGMFLLLAGVNLVTAAILFVELRHAPLPMRTAAATVLLGIVAVLLLFPPPWNPAPLTRGVFMEPLSSRYTEIELLPLEGVPEEELLFQRDGVSSSVSIHRRGELVFLRVNGKTDASSGRDMRTQALSGSIPLLFGGPARDVLVIGYASGVTVGSVARHPVERIDTVEIEPVIIEASRFFDPFNGRPLEDPRVRLFLDDGRRFLSDPERRYDVIISEPSNPWMSGVANLFTREFFRTARRALRPGGRVLQWLPLSGVDLLAFRAVLGALREEFPYVYGFAHAHRDVDFIMMGTLEPLRAEHLPRWDRLPPPVRENLVRFGLLSDEDVWSLLRLTPSAIDTILGNDPPVNRDGNMFVELRTPWNLYQPTLAENWRAIEDFDLAVLPLLLELDGPLDSDRIAALAFSYLSGRGDSAVFEALLRAATERGASAHGEAIQAYVGRHALGLPLERQLALLDGAVRLDPDAALPHLLRAEVLNDMERFEEALAELEQALRALPEDPQAEALRALVLLGAGRSAEAAAATDRLLEQPYTELHLGIWSQAARTYLATGRLGDGITLLERYLGERPQSPGEWELLARALEADRRPEAAGRARRNAETARRNRARLAHRQARVALDQSKPEIAVRLLEDALRLDPEYEPARRELASLPR